MSKRIIPVFLHLIFWLATGWLVVSTFSIQDQEIEIKNGEEVIRTVRNNGIILKLCLQLVIAVIATYAQVVLLRKIASGAGRKKVVFAVLGVMAFGLFLSYQINCYVFFQSPTQLPLSLVVSIFLFYYSLGTAYALVLLFLKADSARKQLQLEKNKADLLLLRNQLQPHFLFNALNNVLAMVNQSVQPKLAQSVEQLSYLTRYLTEDIQKEKISLKKEMDFLRSYAEMQLLRFEDGEVDFQLTMDENLNALWIEPGIFIPLVENAFKHGTEPEKKGVIAVACSKVYGDLCFKVANDRVENPQASTSTHLGLKATRKRLDLVYPNRHNMTVEDSERFVVTVNIQLD